MSHTRFTLRLVPLLLLGGLAACGGEAVEDDGGNASGVRGEQPGSGGTAGEGDEDAGVDGEGDGAGGAVGREPKPVPDPQPEPAGPRAIALDAAATFSDPDPGDWGGTGGSGGAGEAPGFAPGTLYVVLGSYAQQCEAPFESGPCPSWRLAFNLPPELQAPGSVVRMDDPRLNANGSASGPNEGADDCWWGGGTFWDGQLRVLDVNPNGSLRLSVEDAASFDFDPSGRYLVERCD